jgi:hypothetical protein
MCVSLCHGGRVFMPISSRDVTVETVRWRHYPHACGAGKDSLVHEITHERLRLNSDLAKISSQKQEIFLDGGEGASARGAPTLLPN